MRWFLVRLFKIRPKDILKEHLISHGVWYDFVRKTGGDFSRFKWMKGKTWQEIKRGYYDKFK